MKKVRGSIKDYEVEVGVLQDSVHRAPIPNTTTSVAGGPARRKGGATRSTVSQVSEYVRRATGINFYTLPFSIGTNRQILEFTQAYIKGLMSPNGVLSQRRRIENLLQAIVRNPIARGDYGGNTPAAARSKGFSRLLVDTGQLFKSITARVRRR